jgi:hypothetical protein
VTAQRDTRNSIEVAHGTADHDVTVVESETVFTVLAAQARSRSRAGLWTTTIGGGLNAGLIAWQYPSLSWLAAGCVAVAAYGSWGLIDRAIEIRSERSSNADVAADALPDLRLLVALVGTGAGLVAALRFMMWALGAWFR